MRLRTVRSRERSGGLPHLRLRLLRLCWLRRWCHGHRCRRWRLGLQLRQNRLRGITIDLHAFGALIGAHAFERAATDNAIHVAFQMPKRNQMALQLHPLLHGQTPLACGPSLNEGFVSGQPVGQMAHGERI